MGIEGSSILVRMERFRDGAVTPENSSERGVLLHSCPMALLLRANC
jgi:hypothetical protein